MPNHLLLIWLLQPLIHPADVQRDFLKYASQQIKDDLRQHHPAVPEQFKVNAADREYQLWERNPLNIELRTGEVYRQKLGYIHWNPVRAGICSLAEEYKYSSALFYETGIDNRGLSIEADL